MSTLETVMLNRIYRRLLLEPGYTKEQLIPLVISESQLIYEVANLGWVVVAQSTNDCKEEIIITKKKLVF